MGEANFSSPSRGGLRWGWVSMQGQTNKTILQNNLQRSLRRNMTDAERKLLRMLVFTFYDFGTMRFCNSPKLWQKECGRKLLVKKTHPHPLPLLEGEGVLASPHWGEKVKIPMKHMLDELHRLTERAGRPLRLMEVCGTHTVEIFRHGVRDVIPKGISLLSGPGCPVYVTSIRDVDTSIALAKTAGVVLATFGDMMRVPGGKEALNEARSEGAC